MVKNSKQNWSQGSTVKVGFLTLKVLASVPTPGDYAPDAYLLSRGDKLYVFVPHNGLSLISEADALHDFGGTGWSEALKLQRAIERQACLKSARRHFNAAFTFADDQERAERWAEFAAALA